MRTSQNSSRLHAPPTNTSGDALRRAINRSGPHLPNKCGEIPPTQRMQRRSLLALLWVAFASPALAHPISVVTESAYVEQDKVTIEVEVFAEDLYFYHRLKPNERNEFAGNDLRAAAEKHGPLLVERLPVYDAAGQRLPGGRVVSMTSDELPERVPIGELMGYTLVYRLELPLAEPPEFLSFSQRLVESDAGFPALVDFRVKQAGRDDEVEATLKPGDVRTIRFEWTSDTVGASDEAREAWIQAQRDDSLGATALNSVRSFLYIGRRDVRHELLIPFPLIESYFTVDREQPDFLSPSEQESAKPRIADYFAVRNPLTIDGVRQTPATTRVEFFTLEDRNLTQPPKRRTVSAVNARVGILLSYPLEVPPEQVQLVWDSFNRQAWRVDAFVFAGQEVHRPKFSMATRTDTFTWERSAPPQPRDVQIAPAPPPPKLNVPWLGLLMGAMAIVGGLAARRRPALAGGVIAAGITIAATLWHTAVVTVPHPLAQAATLSDEDADEIFRTLHHNLTLATEAATEQEALNTLAAAAEGELLRDLYIRLVRAFREADESGTLPVTEQITLLEGATSQPATLAGFDYAARWEVTGRLEHWGHIHRRRYRYDALFRIEPRGDRWAITALDLREARLVEDGSSGWL